MKVFGDQHVQQTRTTLGDVQYGSFAEEPKPPTFELIKLEDAKQTKLETERKRYGAEYDQDKFDAAVEDFMERSNAARVERNNRYCTIALNQVHGQVLSLCETVRSLELIERNELTAEQGQMLGSLFTYCALTLERTAKLMGHEYRPPLSFSEIPVMS